MKVEYTEEFEKSLKKLIIRERFRKVNPFEYYRQIKWFIQRGRRGYSDADIWNANDHIARTVLAFLEHTETCPMSGYPAPLTEKQWEDKKKEIKWLMEQHLNPFDTPVEEVTSKKYQNRLKKANKIFGEYWQSLWD